MNEQEVLQRLKQQDIEALTMLMEKYQLKAIRTANLITRDEALAQDVVQSVFIRLYKRSHLIDSKRRFEPYLMRTVVNMAINATKQQKRFVSFKDTLDAEVAFTDALATHDIGDPQRALEDAERQRMVADALSELTAKQRAVIVMRYFLDMSESEIAEAHDEPNGTVKWRLHSARNRLRGILSWKEA